MGVVLFRTMSVQNVVRTVFPVQIVQYVKNVMMDTTLMMKMLVKNASKTVSFATIIPTVWNVMKLPVMEGIS